jgi:hypothetical protein
MIPDFAVASDHWLGGRVKIKRLGGVFRQKRSTLPVWAADKTFHGYAGCAGCAARDETTRSLPAAIR